MGTQVRNVINLQATATSVKIDESKDASRITETQLFRRRSSLTQRRLSASKKTKIEWPVYTLEEVSMHDSITDCWVVIYDHVYDVTSFLYEVGFIITYSYG